MTNPYISPQTSPPTVRRRLGWFVSAILLNAVLIGLPGCYLLVMYLIVLFESLLDPANASKDPIVYQHFYWIEVNYWAVIAYLAVPNILLAGLFLNWSRQKTTGGTEEES